MHTLHAGCPAVDTDDTLCTSMPIHVLQCDSSCRVLPVEALEDPVLEKRVHGYRHNGNKCIDGCFLQR